MDAQPANRTFFCGERGVNFFLGGGVEGSAPVTNDEFESFVVGDSIDVDITRRSWRVGLAHHIDHSLFQS